MKVRALKDIFCEGALRRKGEIFDSKSKWKYVEVLDAGPKEVKEAEEKKLNRKEIMAELSAANVSFHATASTEILVALLAEAKAKVAPAAAGSESKEDLPKDKTPLTEQKSSGDVEVI